MLFDAILEAVAWNFNKIGEHLQIFDSEKLVESIIHDVIVP